MLLHEQFVFFKILPLFKVVAKNANHGADSSERATLSRRWFGGAHLYDLPGVCHCPILYKIILFEYIIRTKNKKMGTGREIVLFLTLKAPITTAADDIHKYFSLFSRENKI